MTIDPQKRILEAAFKTPINLIATDRSEKTQSMLYAPQKR
jgi:hypothetical protein